MKVIVILTIFLIYLQYNLII